MAEERKERKTSPSAPSRPYPNKRTRSDQKPHSTEANEASSSTNSTGAELLNAFGTFRDEIDEHNDRRERLIKTSRDVTSLSKKVIFLLHRFDIKDFASAEPSPKTRKLFTEAETKLEEIVGMLRQAATSEGLGGIEEPEQQADSSVRLLRSQRYERNIGGGLEEFVSAVSIQLLCDMTIQSTNFMMILELQRSKQSRSTTTYALPNSSHCARSKTASALKLFLKPNSTHSKHHSPPPQQIRWPPPCCTSPRIATSSDSRISPASLCDLPQTLSDKAIPA